MTLPSKYKGNGEYGDLTEAEKAHWNEYTNLRQISDWPAFDQAQETRKTQSKSWLNERQDEIEELAASDGGWDKADRGLRYDFLSTQNSGSPKHEVRLPASGSATNAEKVYIEEREVYLVFSSTTDEQKARKQANVDWLVAQRKKLYHLIEDDPSNNKPNDRQQRYDNLCIATHHGQVYTDWDKTHNKYGEPISDSDDGSSEPSARSKCKNWLDKYLGVRESPPNSNRGSPQPNGWQQRVYGGTGVPWCACFSVCSAWDNGVSGAGTASCANNISLAKQGRGIYKGYTTDSSKVHAGDHAFIGCGTCHTGVIYNRETLQTVEGNTAPQGGGGSQYNGGGVYKRNRPRSDFIGFGLVRFPD